MSEEVKEAASNQDTLAEAESNVYIRKVHKIGTSTMMIILVLTFCPAIYLCLFKNGFPGWAKIAAAIAAMAGQEFLSWFFEPLMYFPMIGVAGSYLSSTAGNTTSMRIPAMFAAQAAVSAKKGTRKAEVAGVVGVCSSIVVNLLFLIFMVIGGNWLLSVLPETVKLAFNYAVPGLYGALVIILLGMFRRK